MPAISLPNGIVIQAYGVTFDDSYQKAQWVDGTGVLHWTDNPMKPSAKDALVWDLAGNITIAGLVFGGLSGTGYLKVIAGVVTVQAVPIPVPDGGTGATSFTSGAYLKGAGVTPITTQVGV